MRSGRRSKSFGKNKVKLNDAEIITAIGTPLDADETLHDEGLERQLADQASSGIERILVAGSMGVMQMLRDSTYRSLVSTASDRWRAGELLVGVGDTGFARTRDRIELVTQYKIDGVVVLTPYLFKFTQQQLGEYFVALADCSPVPVYLYDLPALTGTSLDMETYHIVARHPNIHGAKISGRLEVALELMEQFGSKFRIIVSAPDKLDNLLRDGILKHLDGMFSIAPHWVNEILRAAAEADWSRAAEYQAKLNQLRDVLLQASNVMAAYTVMMNAGGIPGAFHGLPHRALSADERERIVSTAVVTELVAARETARSHR